MTETQTKKIRVVKVNIKTGTKNGKQWKRTSLESKAGDWYAGFRNIPEGIKEGDLVELECASTDSPQSYDIVKVISVSHAPPEAPETGRLNKGASTPQSKPSLLQDIPQEVRDAIDLRAKARLKRARKIAEEEYPEADYSLYGPIVASINSALYGEEASYRIAKDRRVA